jgi:hypothetical protein
MGKSLINKGADFSENGIQQPIVDVTDIFFANVYQGGYGSGGTIDSSASNYNKRVSGEIVSLESIGAKVGDKLQFVCPSSYFFGIRNGSASNDLSDNSYWYASQNIGMTAGTYYKGDEFVITNDYNAFSIGCNGGSGNNCTVVVSTGDIQGFLTNNTIKVTLIRS